MQPSEIAKQHSAGAIKVFLADHQSSVRELLKIFLLQSRERYEIIGETSLAKQLLRLVEKAQPHIVIFDLSFPDLPVEEVIPKLRKTCPQSRLLAFSQFLDHRLADKAVSQGVHGVVSKESSLDILRAAMEAVCDGGAYFDCHVAGGLFKKEQFVELTEREKTVLRLIAEGLATKEIADRMETTIKSAARSRERIMMKLDLHDAVKLTHYAIRRGLVALQ